MNNIYFFNQFNNLLKTHKQTYDNVHDTINNLIDDKLKYNSEDIKKKEMNIIYKYKELTNMYSIFFDKMSSLSTDIESYLNENCSHVWIIDTIDIDPDRSTLIKYCSNCNTTKF